MSFLIVIYSLVSFLNWSQDSRLKTKMQNLQEIWSAGIRGGGGYARQREDFLFIIIIIRGLKFNSIINTYNFWRARVKSKQKDRNRILLEFCLNTLHLLFQIRSYVLIEKKRNNSKILIRRLYITFAMANFHFSTWPTCIETCILLLELFMGKEKALDKNKKKTLH